MSDADPFEGTQYRVTRRLGAGGMGEVFEVEHTMVGRLMVAKVLRRELAAEPSTVDRMRVEAQALAALSHRNIVGVTDYARTADGRPFYVMERLEGCTLGEDFRKRGAYPVDEAIDVIGQMLAGLEAAHRLGLVHRDIKMDNVFLQFLPSGARVVKLLDFGVAKVLGDRSARAPAPPSLPTAEGAIVGTPRFLSPEQVRGSRQLDHRADIYSTGLVLYALVCGRGPFDHVEHQSDFYRAHLVDEPPAPSEVARQSVPHDLEAAILRALRKNPDDRFQSAADFAFALASIARRRHARVGWLETTPSDPPNAPPSAGPPVATPLVATPPAASPPVASPPVASPPVALPPVASPMPASPAAPDAIPTRTAVPVAEPSPVGQAPVPSAVARPVAGPPELGSPDRRAARRPLPALSYGAAAGVAVAVAAAGLWLTESTLALGAVLITSVIGAALVARLVPVVMR
ncbi:MAG: protein kinase [Myxococcales bacterium]|nr:protein kinase [Myxococcales bacterium]